MSVAVSADRTVALTGECPSDEAELLLQILLANPGATIDWRGCTAAHAAVIQVLMAAGLPVLGPPANPALARWVAPTLASSLR